MQGRRRLSGEQGSQVAGGMSEAGCVSVVGRSSDARGMWSDPGRSEVRIESIGLKTRALMFADREIASGSTTLRDDNASLSCSGREKWARRSLAIQRRGSLQGLRPFAMTMRASLAPAERSGPDGLSLFSGGDRFRVCDPSRRQPSLWPFAVRQGWRSQKDGPQR
jgi:hypothetical protein